jgi:hypothetical protein
MGEMPCGFQGVDLLVHLHGPQLGGKGPPGAAGHDDAGHDRGHQAHHGNAHQIGHVNLGPEELQLDGADKGQDQPHQKTDEGDDGQGLDANGLQDQA